MHIEGSDLSFAFSESFQESIIGHCMTDTDFLRKCINKINPRWFTHNVMLGDVFEELCKYYKKSGNNVKSAAELREMEFFTEQDTKTKEKYILLIDRCYEARKNFDINNVKAKLTGFIRVSFFKETLQSAAQRFKNKGYEDSYSWTRAKIEELKDASFESDNLVERFSDPQKWLAEEVERRGAAISTGSKVLDEALGGGLFRQDNSAIMAPSNTGKTSVLLTIARHAIYKQHNVILITHEGRPALIKTQMLAAFLGVSRRVLMSEWVGNPEKSETIRRTAELIDKYLTFIPYNKSGKMFVEDVVEEIRQRHIEKKAKTGKGFDLIIDDYPKKLKYKYRSGNKDGLYRVEVAEIYDQFVQLAIELDAHCLMAVQTNRAGLKLNNGKESSEFLLGMEEIDEAFGIAQNLGNIITLNRGPEDKKLGILRYNVAKSRNNMTDISINTRTDYSIPLTHGDAEYFKGVSTHTTVPKKFLASYSQPDNKMLKSADIDSELRRIEDSFLIGDEGKSVGYYIGEK